MNIGKYQIQNELGHGAMGIVYKAWDPLLDRYVAIKLISGAFQEKLKTLFEREAKSIARMSDPNIITIYDFNYFEEKPYIVMELLKGLNLEDLTKKTDLDPIQKLNIVSQICRGLTHAHEQTVIHRDIKPSNIFVSESGVAKIMDFGIARLTTATQTHAILGTPEYMSPEQITGEPLDGRSDLFSLGTLFYWLLSGNSPFSADGVHSILFNILNRVPPPLQLSEFSPEQMQELQGILDRSLEKKAEQRYANASEMASDIDSLFNKLKDSGFAETVPLKDKMKTIVFELEKESKTPTSSISQGPIGAHVLEPTAFDGTMQVVGKKPPTLAPPPQNRKSNRTGNRNQPKNSVLFQWIGAAAAVLALFGGYLFFFQGSDSKLNASTTITKHSPPAVSGKRLDLGIAYGSDKQRWLEGASKDFQNTPQGQKINIKLIPLGYAEASKFLLAGDQRIHVWWPTSTLPEELMDEKWKKKYGETLRPTRDHVALTTMVFVIWEDRYAPFIQKYKKLSFATVTQAMQEKNGWSDIAKKPEWGVFGFGHADPEESNTGLMMIQLMAHEYYKKASAITLADVQNPGFLQYLKTFRLKARSLGTTTEEVVQEMILKGPSTYDVAFVNENVAIDYLKEAEDRWGKLRIVYPEYNMWSENPYYVINAPWVTTEQRNAAMAFVDFVFAPGRAKETAATWTPTLEHANSYARSGKSFP